MFGSTQLKRHSLSDSCGRKLLKLIFFLDFFKRMEEKRRSGGWCGWFLVLLVFGAIGFAIFVTVTQNIYESEPDAAPVPGHPGAITKKYADALGIAMQFFEVQKSGKLENNKIPWRGDSGLQDGSEAKLDLSKGMYDAGDHIKFGFPLAFTATVLSWTILEYGDHMKAVNQLEPATDSLKWITDYLVNAHQSDDVLYIQVGSPKLDHRCWNRPENMTKRRPLTQVNASVPGTEVAAETAAALASASLVFKDINSSYSSLLLMHAKQLFTFADRYRESYSISIPNVQKFYNSTGYGDELLWAASWLYHATGDRFYFEYVTGKNGEDFADWGSITWFSWDNKLAGAQVLLSRVNFFGSEDISNSKILLKYRKSAEAVMCNLLPDSPTATESKTNSNASSYLLPRLSLIRDVESFEFPYIKCVNAEGLIWITEWNALQHPVASAFLAVIYSDYMFTSRTTKIYCSGSYFTPLDLRKFAISQVEYVLGKNPMNMSYLVGYGDKYPQYVHHRGASIPADAITGCKDGFKWLDSEDPNPNVAMGALVGGPFLNDSYIDSRNNSKQGEPSTYNSAVIVGLLSGLVTTSSVVLSFT